MKIKDAIKKKIKSTKKATKKKETRPQYLERLIKIEIDLLKSYTQRQETFFVL